MQLTQKETDLLKDLKDQEKLCIDKYTKHAEAANDPQLQQLFRQLASAEQQHLNTLNQISSGQAPSTGSSGSGSNSNSGSNSSSTTFTATYSMADSPEKKQDCYLCTDLLAGEKHVSSLYNTSVFEFGQSDLRKALNHIQTEEQGHGEQIYQYMKTNNMYS